MRYHIPVRSSHAYGTNVSCDITYQCEIRMLVVDTNVSCDITYQCEIRMLVVDTNVSCDITYRCEIRIPMVLMIHRGAPRYRIPVQMPMALMYHWLHEQKHPIHSTERVPPVDKKSRPGSISQLPIPLEEAELLLLAGELGRQADAYYAHGTLLQSGFHILLTISMVGYVWDEGAPA
jgi:hypothetical protein